MIDVKTMNTHFHTVFCHSSVHQPHRGREGKEREREREREREKERDRTLGMKRGSQSDISELEEKEFCHFCQ